MHRFFLARIQKLLARTYEIQDNVVLTHKGLTLNLLKAEISYQGQRKSLTKNEMGILRLLMVNKGNIIPRDAIIDELWQSEQFIDENTLNVNIVRLRKTLAEIGLPDYLEIETWLGVVAYEIIRVSSRSNFSLICMLVSALLLFGLLWLIETSATFILFAETILMAAYISALVYDFFRKRSYYNLLLK